MSKTLFLYMLGTEKTLAVLSRTYSPKHITFRKVYKYCHCQRRQGYNFYFALKHTVPAELFLRSKCLNYRSTEGILEKIGPCKPATMWHLLHKEVYIRECFSSYICILIVILTVTTAVIVNFIVIICLM